MTGRKNAPTPIQPKAGPSLAELLADGSDNDGFDFSDVEWPVVGNFIAAAAGMGALVSFYRSDSDGSFVVSIRLGSDRKSYGYDNARQLSAGLKLITNKLLGWKKGRPDPA